MIFAVPEINVPNVITAALMAGKMPGPRQVLQTTQNVRPMKAFHPRPVVSTEPLHLRKEGSLTTGDHPGEVSNCAAS
jgi:hypothetical protein